METPKWREITWQSIVGGVLIAAVVAGAYPYVVLKLGMGPDASMLSAFLGALFLGAFAAKTRGLNKGQNNVIQTIAGSAAATAFMCVVLAAFSYLQVNWSMEKEFTYTWWQIALWLTCSGSIGVLIVVRYRKFFLDHPRMRFPGGVAAAEVINVLDDPTGAEGKKKTRVLGFATAGGAIISLVRDAFGWLPAIPLNHAFKVALPFDSLAFGTGMLLSLNVGLSGLLGALIVWICGPMIVDWVGLDIVRESIAAGSVDQCMALAHGTLDAAQTAFVDGNCGLLHAYHSDNLFGIGMLWFMWPATAFMITGAVTSIAMAFAGRKKQALEGGNVYDPAYKNPNAELDVPIKVTLIGVVILTICLAILQDVNFGVSWEQTAVAVISMVLLILAGVWVLGETNSGPVSLMANAAQAVFGAIWPGHTKANLITAGMAGDGNSQGEQVMQTYKTGRIVGSTPRLLTYAQLLGVPIGALAVAIMYPLLLGSYGIGGDDGLSAPTGLKLANMAVLLKKGAEAFPPGALTATAIAAVLGVVFEFLRALKSDKKDPKTGRLKYKFPWVPSASALGFGLILPPELNIMLAAGAVFSWAWRKKNPESFERYFQAVAAGLVAGEALIGGLLLPILAAAGVL